MKTFAVLGTCTSEDWYHHQSPRSRLPLKQLALCQQSALVTLNARPVPIPDTLGTGVSGEEALKLRMDFDRSFLPGLVPLKPDVLIVDLLLDSLRGVMDLEEGWVTNSYLLRKSGMGEACGGKKTINPVTEQARYLDLFTASVDFLAAFLREKLPGCRVILHKARWAEYYLDKDGFIRPFDPGNQVSYFMGNQRIRGLEAAFRKAIPCEVLAVEEMPVLADVQHIWGLSALHYHKEYYRHFQERLRLLLRD